MFQTWTLSAHIYTLSHGRGKDMLVCGRKLGRNNPAPDVNSKCSLLPPSIASADIPPPMVPAGKPPASPGIPEKLPPGVENPPGKSLVICSCKFGK